MLRFIFVCFIYVYGIPCQGQELDKELFRRLFFCTRYFEGWHTQATTPGYIGYGHQIQTGETFPIELTRKQVEDLLVNDLRKIYRMFKNYGKDAYLLTALAYQIGPSKLLGTNGYPKSLLLRKQENGDRDIKTLYLRFCKWNGHAVKSIRVRRTVEMKLLYQP